MDATELTKLFLLLLVSVAVVNISNLYIRQQEYQADWKSMEFTKHAESLSAALDKMAFQNDESAKSKKSPVSKFFDLKLPMIDDHPTTEERLIALKKLS